MQPVESTINFLIAQSVGTSISADIPLMEAGIDSLAAGEVVESIGKSFAMELPATLLFDHPSIASISKHVMGSSAAPSLCQSSVDSGTTPARVLSQENIPNVAVVPKILPKDVAH